MNGYVRPSGGYLQNPCLEICDGSGDSKFSRGGVTQDLTSFQKIPIERVEEYWDARPCNIRHSPSPVGTREYFDEVERRKYAVEPHIPRFAEFPRWRDKKVLEIGCGIGTDTINFARHGARVTAVELSGRSLEIARQRAKVYGIEDRIRFYQANAQSLTRVVPIEPYDLVYSFGVLHHTPEPERAFQEIKNYLRPGSTIKVMMYHRCSWKALWIVVKFGKAQFWRIPELVAQYSEAQEGCPVTYTFTRKELDRLLKQYGFEVTGMSVDHIFPYRIQDYVNYRYVKVWYFRAIPEAAFRWMEHHWGWHLCVTAEVPGISPHSNDKKPRAHFRQESTSEMSYEPD